jgi:hypothetical protein
MNYLLDLGMILGPTTGYLFQYKMIRDTKDIGSFSIDICGILIFANIIRIFFWYTKNKLGLVKDLKPHYCYNP